MSREKLGSHGRDSGGVSGANGGVEALRRVEHGSRDRDARGVPAAEMVDKEMIGSEELVRVH